MMIAAFAALLISGNAQAEIVLQADMIESQRRTIRYDFGVLDRLVPLDDADSAAAAAKMGLAGKLTADSLREWLEARVKYIVPQEWNYQTQVKVGEFQNYPNRGLMPTIEEGKKSEQSGKAVIVMSNLGGALYLYGKENYRLLTVEIDRRHREKIKSPRIGLIQVGEGLFSDKMRIEPESDTEANALLRLAVYFHESRHSDGNGTSILFAHAVCPTGHAYAGSNACDRNRNGPYTVGAHMTKVLLNQCTNCTTAAKEALRLRVVDSFSRVIQTTNVPATLASKAMLEANVVLCDTKKILNQPEPAECAEYRRKLELTKKGVEVPTIDLDASPESI